MISYFIPISLMVLAGFALGLLVGRLAWGSSRSDTGRATEESTVPGEVQEAATTGSSSVFDEAGQELPVWRMKEVHQRHRRTDDSSPADADRSERSGGSAKPRV